VAGADRGERLVGGDRHLENRADRGSSVGPLMPRQESDWSAAIGTWKIGRRDDALSLLSGVRRTTTNSDTRLVGNYDPVTGKHSVAHFSVGKAGWRNHRKKPAPEWMMHAHSHPRAITAPRQAQLGERKVALRENAATPGSPVVFFGDAMPMEGRTVLATPTSVKTSPPHPARKYAETMRRLTPKENLPRRVGLQQSAAREQRELGGQVPILNAGDVRKLLQRLVVSSLETAMMQLENALSSEPAQGVSPADLERMLFTAHWKCEDDQMLALRRVYACNAGVDADLVVRDMKECISRPGFGAARYPAAMQIIVASLQHRMQILEARFIKSDVEVRENNKCVGARERGEEPANHVDVEVFGQHLKCCGFPADSIVMAQMQRLYCCVEGLWMGLLDYQRFLVDLRKAASSFFAAATDASQWAYNLPSDVKPEKRDVAAWMEGAAGRLRPETSAEEEDHRSFEPDVQVDGVKRVEFWTRPSTAESDIRRCNLRSGIRGQDELSRARPCSSRPGKVPGLLEHIEFGKFLTSAVWNAATSDSGKQDILNMTSTSSESLLASMFFGNSSAILRQVNIWRKCQVSVPSYCGCIQRF